MPDYIIKNGWIVDGKSKPPYQGEVAVSKGKIQEISSHITLPSDFPKEQILDAKGGYITPGFIDIHRHGDWEALKNGDDELLNRQGITTVINGNCGLSIAPAGKIYQEEINGFLSSVTGEMTGEFDCQNSMSSYMKCLSQIKRSVNTGMLGGNGTIRACVKGYAPGRLTKDEMSKVWRVLEETLEAGVLGISLGLAYAPEFEYEKEDLVKVLSPIKHSDVPIVTHVRNEGDGLFSSIREVIYLAEKLEVPLHISHMKCIGKKNWGKKSHEVLDFLHSVRDIGGKVDYDLYPYLTGSTQLVHVLPPEAQKGGVSAIIKRLSDEVYRKKLTEILKRPSDEFENIVGLAGFENIYASTLHSKEYAPYAGWSLAKIAEVQNRNPYETLYDILIAENCQVTMLDTIASEEDMLYFLKDDMANLISDAIYPSGGKYHPRVYGAFPKFLVEYVREKHVFSIEEAVYKMTGKPAAVLHMNRGVMEKGNPADINIFRLENLKAPADFQNPIQFSEGFDYVMTNGQLVLNQGVWSNRGSGKAIVR